MKNILITLSFLMGIVSVNGQSYDGKGDSKIKLVMKPMA